MKVKKELFSMFVKETALAGDHALKEVKLDFGEKGLTMTSITDGQAILVKAQIPASSFEDYAEFGEIAILNYTELQKIIATLKEDITIKKEGNVLVLKGGRKVEIPLADVSHIKNSVVKFPNLEYPYAFTINKKFFDEIAANLSFSLNRSDSCTIEFVGENKTLKANYGTKYKFEDGVVAEGINDKFNVKFGQALLNALANITGDIQLQMKENYPMTITKKTDMFALRVMVAPKS